MLGVIPGDFTEEQRSALGVPVSEGLRLDGVLDGMGAQKCGLQRNDVLVAMAGKPITNDFNSLPSAIAGKKGGDKIEVSFYRGAEKNTVTMELTKRPMAEVPFDAAKLAKKARGFYESALAELEAFDARGHNVARGALVTSSDSIEAPVRWARANLTDGIHPFTPDPATTLETLQARREALLGRLLDERKLRDRAMTTAAIERTEQALADLPPLHKVYAGTVHHGSGTFRGTGADGGRPRPIHLLARGQVTRPRQEMQPAGLAVLAERLPGHFALAIDAPEGARRAALARWITDPRNPLTWRSIVNRVWQYHFGRGLVDTPDDFGHMGSPPTHPELLDWLAVTFRDDLGGSLKALHRLIVTSAAYRQASSTENATAAASDSGNTLLWRANARKLEAEALRDAVLSVSGTLDLTAGGPGWQDFVIEHPEHSPHYRYDLADPDDRRTFRRSIYRFVVRSQTQPFLTAFDCADPSMRVDKRNECVSPAQALALLNSGFILAQAKHFAARVATEAGPDPQAQVGRAFALATGRQPTATERATLAAHAERHGMASACRLLFNLNEFVFVD